MSFTVLHAPLYAPGAKKNSRALIGRLRELNASTVGLSEAYGVVDKLVKVPGYRLVLEHGGRDDRRGQFDNPILVREGLASLGSGQFFGAPASTPSRIAPERWFTYSTVDTSEHGPICHLSLHPHAAVQGDDGGLNVAIPRGRAFARQMTALDRFLDFAEAQKWAIVVTGDVNFRDKPVARDLPASPHRIMRAHGLDVHAQGLDVIAGSKRLHLEVREVAAPGGATDHPWLLGRARG